MKTVNISATEFFSVVLEIMRKNCWGHLLGHPVHIIVIVVYHVTAMQ